MANMTRWSFVVVACVLVGGSALAVDAPAGYVQELEAVAEGVWVLRQPAFQVQPAGNVTVIEQSDGLVLVDTGGSPGAGRRVVERVRALGPKPVKAVILTHWHGDHVLGLSAILEAWPEARTIATRATQGHLRTPKTMNVPAAPDEARNRELREQHQGFAEYSARMAAEAGTEAERAGWVGAERLFRQYVLDMDGALTLTTAEGFTDRLTLEDAAAPVEVLFLGRANTDGDAVVWLPEQRVLVTGDVVVAPVPFGFGSYPAEWIGVLERLMGFDFAVLVPGHGPPQRDRSYLDRLSDLLGDVRSQVRRAPAVATLEEVRSAVDLGAHRARFVGDDPWLGTWFDRYWTAPIVASAFKESRGEIIVQSLDPAAAADPLPPKAWEVVTLAEGVHGFVWTDPLQDPVEGNALFIVNDEDVVVVDAGLLPSTARRMANELRKLTDKPVRYVVNTHWHDDHHLGNQVYRELWPGVEFVAHRLTRQDAIELTHEARPRVLADYAEQTATVSRWLEQGHDDDGKPLDDARRERIARFIALLDRFSAEAAAVVATLPDLVFDDALVLHRGERTIEVRFLGLGNTRGDVVVFLPRERIVATGDLLVHPAPFAFGSNYREWAATLEALDALEADVLFPGHGPVLRDRAYLHQVRDLLKDLVAQVDAAVAEGLTLEQTRERVTLADWQARFAQGDEAIGRAFESFFVQPAVQRAWELATGVAAPAEGVR
ncbi:MAG TPA: MBL fold metallo-hydrolase [Thermoanaerobaculia bacterium]